MRTTRIGKVSLAVAVGPLAALMPLGVREADAAAALFDFPCSSAGSAIGDFDANGKPDLAVGAPGDDLEKVEADGSISAGVIDAGSINVTYSDNDAAKGLNPAFRPHGTSRVFFSQNTPSISDSSEKDDNFGFALAAGNFDGRFGADLAVGLPGENGGSGAVQVLYSAENPDTPSTVDSAGLSAGVAGTAAFNKLINQDSPGVDGVAETGDQFGYSLAAGDLNGDGHADLLVGAPKEDIGTRRDAGLVHVLYGTPSGLRATPSGGVGHVDQMFEQGPGVSRTPEVGRTESGDFFGASLAVGQLNDDGALDVAAGAPGEDIGSAPDAGAVKVLYASGTSGLSNAGSDFFHQGSVDLEGGPESADRFACSLAAGDFDGDQDDDLAVGVPGESIGADRSAGVVQILYNSGRATGIAVDDSTTAPVVNNTQTFWRPDQVWGEDDGAIPGDSGSSDRMGASLAVGNFDAGNTPEDLAIGLPTEMLYDHKGAGSVRVIYGSRGFGLTDAQPSALAQSPRDLASSCLLYGILDDLPAPLDAIPACLFGPSDYSPLLMIEEEGDTFGASLAAADFDADGRADIAIGSPGEDLGLFVNWLSEEELTIPDELLSQFGIPVSLEVDEADNAGALNIIYGPLPTVGNTPARQDLLYREGNSPFKSLRSFLHSVAPVLQDNQVHPAPPGDPSYSPVLDGDGFGSAQS